MNNELAKLTTKQQPQSETMSTAKRDPTGYTPYTNTNLH